MIHDRRLTVSAASQWLGYDHSSGPRRVRRLIEGGRLKAENHGAGGRPYWLIRLSELERFSASLVHLSSSDVQEGTS